MQCGNVHTVHDEHYHVVNGRYHFKVAFNLTCNFSVDEVICDEPNDVFNETMMQEVIKRKEERERDNEPGEISYRKIDHGQKEEKKLYEHWLCMCKDV